MSMLALEACLLLGLCATFGVVGVLARHLDAPDFDIVDASHVPGQPRVARTATLPDAVRALSPLP